MGRSTPIVEMPQE